MTVVLGIGNEFRRDDGAGPQVIRLLGYGRILTGEGTELLDAWEGLDHVILVDAVLSGAPPGTVHRRHLKPGDVELPPWRGSTHLFGVADAIHLAAVLNRLPPLLTLYGIEAESFGYGIELSPPVAAACHQVADEIRTIMRPV